MEYYCEDQADMPGKAGQSCLCKMGLDVPAKYFTEHEKALLLKHNTIASSRNPCFCRGTWPKALLGTNGMSLVHSSLAEITAGVVARLQDGGIGTSEDSTTDDGAFIPAWIQLDTEATVSESLSTLDDPELGPDFGALSSRVVQNQHFCDASQHQETGVNANETEGSHMTQDVKLLAPTFLRDLDLGQQDDAPHETSSDDGGGNLRNTHHSLDELTTTAQANEYPCITQQPNISFQKVIPSGLRLHLLTSNPRTIPRWRPGSTLYYFVERVSGVLNDQQYRQICKGMKDACLAWSEMDIKISFERVMLESLATFRVIYCPKLDQMTFAEAFFPDQVHELRLLRYGDLTIAHLDRLFHIMCHEIGHIIGIRHEFCFEDQELEPSLRFPSDDCNPDSVMNSRNAHDLSHLVVSRRDGEDVRQFYELPAGLQPNNSFIGNFLIQDYDSRPPRTPMRQKTY
jgi:hypothetical protein